MLCIICVCSRAELPTDSLSSIDIYAFFFTFVKELSPTWAVQQVGAGLLFEVGVEERAPF